MRILLGCMMAALVWSLAVSGAAAADAWHGLMETARNAGLGGEAEVLVQACRTAGWEADQAEVALAPVIAAARNGDAWDFVATKVREGLAKGIGAAQVGEVASNRLTRLREARSLMEASRGETRGGAPGLVEALASGLESGFTAETLSGVLSHPANPAPGQIRAAIEAGEILRLEGLPDILTEALMNDFLTRNLRRSDILRAVQQARLLHRRGEVPDRLREELWGTPAAGTRTDGPGRHRGRGDGDGSGAGRQTRQGWP